MIARTAVLLLGQSLGQAYALQASVQYLTHLEHSARGTGTASISIPGLSTNPKANCACCMRRSPLPSSPNKRAVRLAVTTMICWTSHPLLCTSARRFLQGTLPQSQDCGL